MILVDANLLLFASFPTFSQHEAARDWLDKRLNGQERVGLPWATLLAFVRIATNPRAFQRPASIERAWEQVESWLGCRQVWIPEPTERHVDILGALLLRTGRGGNLVTDAHLAALALEHGLVLCTADDGFARFPTLDWENPLRPWKTGQARAGSRRVRAAARPAGPTGS